MKSCFVKSYVVFSFFLVFVGCSDKNREESSKAVITVGNRSLTFDQLKKQFSGYSSDSTKVFNYISGWIEKELLYQEGVSLGLLYDSSLIKKTFEYERQIVGKSYLDLSSHNISIDDVLIKNYYNSNKAQFVRKEREADVFYFVVDGRSAALKIKKEIKKTQIKDLSRVLFKHGGIYKKIRFGELPEKLNSKIFSKANFKTGNLLGPYLVEKKYHVIKIENIYRDGDLLKIESVYDEIYQRLKNEAYSVRYQQVVDSLSFQYPITIDIHKIRRMIAK